MKKYIKYYFLFFLTATWISLLGQYNFIKYSLQEGLPQSQVFTGFQDSKGYLWFGTQGGGVSRFDGEGFENFTTKHGLPSNYIKSISQDNIGNIWVGSNSGIAYLDGERFHSIYATDSSSIDVNKIISLPDSSLWVATEKGIYQYKNHELQKLEINKGLDNIGVNDFLVDEDDIWIATNNGVWLIGDKVKRFTQRDGLTGNLNVSLLKDKEGNIWVATYDGGLSIYNKDKHSFTVFKGITNIKNPLFIYENHDNHIWIGSRNYGIYNYNPKDSTWNIINQHQGLPHNHIRNIFRDKWDNTWICTSGGGVAKYLGQFFAHYDMNNGLAGKFIYALENDNEGNLLFSTSNNGLMSYDGFGFHKYTADSNYINVKAKTIFKDHIGNIWIGTQGKGLVKIDTGGQRKIFTTDNGLTSNLIQNITEDNSGNIWIATNDQGITRISSINNTIKSDSSNLDIIYRFRTYTREDGLPDMYISTLKKSKDGHIWFGTKLGNLGYFEDDFIAETFNQESGIPKMSIRSIAFDIYHNIWLGTAGGGLFIANSKLKDISFSPMNSEFELYSDNIYSLLFDPEGNLWVGSESGVDKIDLNDASIVRNITHFGRNEGFHGIETCQDAALVGLNGVLWFGTMNGLMNHMPGHQLNTIDTPIIHFKDISLFYKPISNTEYKEYINSDGSLNHNLSLPYNKNHLNFEFKAININNAKNIKYKWKLQGSEKEWSPLSEKTSVDYSNLPAGNYCFEVMAVSNKGVPSNTIQSCFSIKKPFWKLIWVQLLFGLVLISMIGYLFWRWKLRIESNELQKRTQLEMQNNVLQLEQKALQLQMNPHFIFNALNSIQSLIATNENRAARVQISNFATLMRGILLNSRREKISLAEEINVLEKYLQMEQFCQKTPFEFTISVDKNLEPDDIDLPPMILQPYVENAIIHGISHLQKSGKLKIEFISQELASGQQLLVCTITDNGVGRKKSNELRQSTKPGHQSISMDVTKDRLNALRGTETYKALMIDDVVSLDDEIIGTKVVVKIPFEGF